MIDLGLSKLALIGVISLLVIGPERLPKVARMAGNLFGRAQRYLNEVKSEVSRSIEFDELRKLQQDMQQAAGDVEQSFAHNVSQLENDLHVGWFERAGDEVPNPLSHASPELLPPRPDHAVVKAKDFRKKRSARTSAIPSWYKRQSMQRTRVISGAAHVARRRSSGTAGNFFH